LLGGRRKCNEKEMVPSIYKHTHPGYIGTYVGRSRTTARRRDMKKQKKRKKQKDKRDKENEGNHQFS
jgi:hypothetical protein